MPSSPGTPVWIDMKVDKQLNNTAQSFSEADSDATRYRQEAHQLRATVSTLQGERDGLQANVSSLNAGMQQLKQSHADEVKSLNSKHDLKGGKEKNKISDLQRALLASQESTIAWPDKRLRTEYDRLKRDIEAIASPDRQANRIPPQGRLPPTLDPTGFLQRVSHTKGPAHFLIKTEIRDVLHRHFFSIQYGFGAFGKENGK
ncbi:hypothetical protein MKZ38_010510 [Zalerion maritima]|uniref:Uncharacterized protein n=1 Tax=Zalerion maritima TaxID=339359 RepID=A0AAD5RFE8_9PEZI|nr:hypothetical protein MKZ38_010510 [Zalerion maritima]